MFRKLLRPKVGIRPKIQVDIFHSNPPNTDTEIPNVSLYE